VRLVEYLFGDPGGPPQPDYGYSTMAVDGEGLNGLETRTEHPSEYGYGTPGVAHMDGRPIPHLARPYDQGTAMRYRAMLGFHESIDEAATWKRERAGRYISSDGWIVEQFQGTLHPRWGVWPPGSDTAIDEHVLYGRTLREAKAAADRESNDESIDEVRIATDKWRINYGQGQVSRTFKTRKDVKRAFGQLAQHRAGRKGAFIEWFDYATADQGDGDWIPLRESIDEVLKKGENVQSAGDNKAIARLEKGAYPARAEDGMGFCFQWADGRGICAFRLKADALRWAKEQPRDIVKFWYGEPVHSNGKFRIRVVDHYSKEESLDETWASDIKKLKMAKDDEAIPTMWKLEARLRASGHLHDGLSLTFFCPVYFAGQMIVEALLDKTDENGELLVFSLPSITDPERIQIGLAQMLSLGIKDPERHLKRIKKGKDKGKLALRCYSMLPGIEGVGSAINYAHIGQEAVQLGAFMLVPDEWVNEGDPYNKSYRFPGEVGYSPYWRIPPFNEMRKIRPKLAADFLKGGTVRRPGTVKNESITKFSELLNERSGSLS